MLGQEKAFGESAACSRVEVTKGPHWPRAFSIVGIEPKRGVRLGSMTGRGVGC